MPNAPLALQPSKVILSSIQGYTLNVAGTLTLPVTLAPNLEPFNIKLYIIREFALHCDGLLGLESLIAYDINIFPKRHALFSGELFYPAMTDCASLLSIAALSDSQLATPSAPAQPPSPVEGKRSPSTPWPVSAVVIGDQYIGPSSATRLSVRLSDAPVGSRVMSCLKLCVSTVCLSRVHSHRYALTT